MYLLKSSFDRLRVSGKQKIFCIGRNKTGTTSLKESFKDLGFIVGNQRQAELLLNYYKKGDFKPIVKYCKSAQVFQDFPFSFPRTYQEMDMAFPGSKFILTVRDSPEQWYNSVTKFHAKLFGKGQLPSSADLQQAAYVWKGWIWECNRILYETPESDPYKKEMLMAHYEAYNAAVIDYFKDRPNDLLIVNVSETEDYQRFCSFIGVKSDADGFPWENRTSKIDIKK